MKRITRVMMTVILALSFGLAFAQNGDGRKQNLRKNDQDGPRAGRQEMLMEKLDINEEQLEKVHDARTEFEKKAIKLRAYIKVKKIEVDEMIMDGKPASKIEPTLSEISSYELALSKARTEMEVKVRDIVGEDAYKQLKRRHHMMGERRGGKDGRNFRNAGARHGDGDGMGYRVNAKGDGDCRF